MPKTPSEELLEHLQQHRQKMLQPPPEPVWTEDPGEDAPEPSPPADGVSE